MGVSFLAQNAGKKSVTVNLKHPRGKELFLKLVKTADMVVENFRPGVMTGLGVGYEKLIMIQVKVRGDLFLLSKVYKGGSPYAAKN